MNDQLLQTLLKTTGATNAHKVQTIQSLWSGYGEIARYELIDAQCKSVVVKHVTLPDEVAHPRGWNTNLSHQRKIRSYEVECAWYQQYSLTDNDNYRMPKCYGTVSTENEFLMVLEDLDVSGFSVRKQQASISDMKACLQWLAHFHANFLFDNRSTLHKSHDKLWEVGTYWHLDTRPDELKAMEDSSLKQAAQKIDQILKDCPFQTLVHGDAKLANFCFSATESKVAAVDFQYVGAGCGMKDVAYFIGSCLDSDGCDKYADELVDFYFHVLQKALGSNNSEIPFNQVEGEWRPMYAMAIADFQRFLKGWSPEHWKIHPYSEAITHKALDSLQ